MTTSVTPVSGLIVRTAVQVWPPSVGSQSPRSPPPDHTGPMAGTYTPSRVPGWSRAHVVAHVGYHARALARLIEGAAAGVPVAMYDGPSQQAHEVEFGATLPVEALRNLVAHAAVHLNVEWRDLPELPEQPGGECSGEGDCTGCAIHGVGVVTVPGRGGIDRGPGSAPLTWGEATPELRDEMSAASLEGSIRATVASRISLRRAGRLSGASSSVPSLY